MDPRRLIQRSYDELAPRYLEWSDTVRQSERRHYAQRLQDSLAAGSRVLDLGCGPGGSTTLQLAARFRVIGVDISWQSLSAARSRIPQAQFVQADMTEVDFAPASIDGIAAFYSLIHVPRRLLATLFDRMAAWTRPGGVVALSLGVTDAESGTTDDWLGVPMYWSSFLPARSCEMLESSGFDIISAREESALEFGAEVRFLWVVASRR